MIYRYISRESPVYYYVKYTGLVIRIIKDYNTWKCIYRNI